MTRAKHSYVPFYMDDWKAGTAHMPRMVRSVYFDICVYTWDKVKPVPGKALVMMLSDLPNGREIVEALVEEGALTLNTDGSIHSPRALAEAQKAFDLWERKSVGGKTPPKSPAKTPPKSPAKSHGIEPEPEPEPEVEETPSEPPLPAPGPAEVADAWNEMAAASGLKQIKTMTNERQKKLGARIAEHGAQALIDGIKTIPDSEFLMGGGDRGWVANFDSILRPDNCAKLIEGVYHQQGRGRRSGWVD